MEWQRLVEQQEQQEGNTGTTDWADHATIIQKGAQDVIGVGFDPVQPIVCPEPGGWKRSGGIGDILAGTVGTLAAWQFLLSQQQRRGTSSSSWIPAAWTACHLVKRTTHRAWMDKKRAMTAPDVLARLGDVFDEMIGQEFNMNE